MHRLILFIGDVFHRQDREKSRVKKGDFTEKRMDKALLSLRNKAGVPENTTHTPTLKTLLLCIY